MTGNATKHIEYDAGPETSLNATPKPDAEAMSVGMQMPDTSAVAPPAADHQGHAHADGNQPVMSADMAHEMGHGGNMDLPAMVRDMRNRFWICLLFSVPIFIYSPMGNMFPAPTPPFGLPLNQWLFGLASAAILYPSWPFFVGAWRALKTGTLNMATLATTSSLLRVWARVARLARQVCP